MRGDQNGMKRVAGECADRPRRTVGPFGIFLAVVLAVSVASPTHAFAAVASLGDSYSSGEGAGPFDSGTQVVGGNGCDRSSRAWPRLLGVPKANHFACSGATTHDFYESSKDAVSQLESLRALAAREPISKVYVTIGGNDLGFSHIIKDCFTHSCLRRMDDVELPKLQNKVRPAVAKALQEARVAAGGQVILVGYPNLIPSRGSSFVKCGWLTDGEKPRVWKLEDALDTALSQAAVDAGVSYVSIRDALAGHELCTRDSWINPIGLARKSHVQQEGHPNADGQEAIAEAVRSAQDVGAGVVPLPSARCVAANNVAAIVDDSFSMSRNDPLDIRGAAMQLLITKPGGQLRTLGAVEFGSEAGPLFEPAVISAEQAGMMPSLLNLRDDGFFDGGEYTDYNAAFDASAAEQPSASARIFLTDGEHNVGTYEDGHRGGPRTYVIGLNIGPSGEGNPDADLLGRIASETGGFYFPLLRSPGDSAETQSSRIQPVFNAIDALLQCHGAPQQVVRTLEEPNAPTAPVSSRFAGAAGLEIVVSWTTPGTQIALASATIRNAGGAVIANLTGKRPPKRHRKGGKKVRRPALLHPGIVQGGTFETITVPRPRHGSSLAIAVTAPALTAPTAVTVQISPLQTLPPGSVPSTAAPGPPAPGGGGAPLPSPPPPPPPPPANHLEQETPNHPVNTFTNYHNASGMGPPIAAGQWVEVSCRVYDPTIASVNPDGYWYRIASPPWSNAYYSPANTFMNGDPYGGPYTHNTDFSVPVC
jgi:lysophospholipase L1-like esterase